MESNTKSAFAENYLKPPIISYKRGTSLKDAPVTSKMAKAIMRGDRQNQESVQACHSHVFSKHKITIGLKDLIRSDTSVE